VTVQDEPGDRLDEAILVPSEDLGANTRGTEPTDSQDVEMEDLLADTDLAGSQAPDMVVMVDVLEKLKEEELELEPDISQMGQVPKISLVPLKEDLYVSGSEFFMRAEAARELDFEVKIQ
jgi:hypothetical protein